MKEDRIRRSLATEPIESVTLGTGGRSVAFKIVLRDRVVGYYKPEQTFAANWYSELASYYLDRDLGLGRVPPAIGRRIAWKELEAAARQSPYAGEVTVQKDGTVRGAFVWWVPQDLVALSLPPQWEGWLRISGTVNVSPFQRSADYRKARTIASSEPASSISPVPETRIERVAELSDLVLFDFLINNNDRWGGGFTNVRTLGDDGSLVFMDNANGFAPGVRVTSQVRAKLLAVQKFRLSTVRAIESYRASRLEKAMARDPLAPILTESQLRNLEARRREVVEHIHSSQARFGKAAIL